MYSAQQAVMTFLAKRRQAYHDLIGEDNVPSLNDQRTSLTRTWNNLVSGNYLKSMRLANRQLSVTVVNDKILMSNSLNPSTKDQSYILHQEKLLCLQQYPSKVSILKRVHVETNDMQDCWHIVDDPNSVKIKNDINLTQNFDDTYRNNNTMESHATAQVNEAEKKTNNDMTDFSGPSDVESRKCEVDIYKDIDVESFLVVSHSDVPTSVDPIKKSRISRFSDICQNAWNSWTSRFYCDTESTRMSAKRPLYLTKQHHRRKANVIAIGRGRGRAKCQLRRSGVSQTVCRKEYIKDDKDEICQSNLVGTAPNDCPLDSILDNLVNINIPAQVKTKQNDNLSTFSSPKATNEKPKARKKKTKAKYVTKVRYTTSKITDRNYCKDSNSEMPNAQEDSSRSRMLSVDAEDDWIVFEDDDDTEKLPETREKRGAIEYPIRARYVPNSSMRKKDSSYEDFNSKIHNAESVSFRLRSSSESSTGSEDSNNSSTVSDEEGCLMRGCLTKINVKYCRDLNSQMQKDSFKRCRLPSNSSEISDISNSSFATERNDDVDSYDEMSFHNTDSQDDSIIFVDEDSEKNSNNSDTSNSSFTTEENDDIDGYCEMSLQGEASQDNSIIFAHESNDELTAQTKKVSFDPTPVVHVMVTWDYAYRAARKGPWEEFARDNERFRGRINSIAIVLDPILKSTHRSQVWLERFSFPE